MPKLKGEVTEFEPIPGSVPLKYPPIEGIRVIVSIRPESSKRTTYFTEMSTKGDGRYEFDLDPGEYVVNVEDPKGVYSTARGATRTFSIKRGDHISPYNFRLKKKRASPGPKPKPPGPTPPPVPPTPTIPGEIDVGQKKHPELNDERAWKQRVGNIPNEKFKTELSGEITLKPSNDEGWGRIRGRVIDSQGKPIEDAAVSGPEDQDMTDNTGSYELNAKAGRSYRVTAQKEGYSQGGTKSPVVVAGGIVNTPDMSLKLLQHGRLLIKVIDSETRNYIPRSVINIIGPSATQLSTLNGIFDLRDQLEPGNYKVEVTADGYGKGESDEFSLEAGESKSITIKLKKEDKKTRKQKTVGFLGRGIPLLRKDWWFGKEEGDNKGKNQLFRLVISIGLTILLHLTFFRPFFSAIGMTNPFFSYVIPFIAFLIIWFTVAPKISKTPDWGPLILATGSSVLLVALIFLWGPKTLKDIFFGTPYFGIGSVLAVFLLMYNMPKSSGGWTKTMITYAQVMALLGAVILIWNLVDSGNALKLETYLKTFDVLHLVGVPQDTVDNLKEGVRRVLSFLTFKGAEPPKQEAKKIGGFEAIQFKFGTRHNNYVLPTLFARMEYTIPISVTNPNKFDTNLLVKDFVIDEIYLRDGSKRVLCGVGQDKGKVLIGDIPPEIEKSATIDFKDRTDCVALWVAASPETRSEDHANPMYPARVTFAYDDETKCREPSGDEPFSDVACRNVLNNYYDKYVHDKIAKPDDVDASYTDDTCRCDINRYYNALDELCFFERTDATVILRSNYDFSVQGKGELILVKSNEDLRLAPKPSITSSAGPITLTTYFVSDIHVLGSSGLGKAVKMFLDVRNDGTGSASLDGIKINGIDFPDGIVSQTEVGDMSIGGCSPQSINTLSVSDGETVTIVCGISVNPAASVTGDYKTIPIIIDIDYEYSQSHSVSVPIKKESIPEEVSQTSQIRELDQKFNSLPYYCPNEQSAKVGTPALEIYNTKTQSPRTTDTPPQPKLGDSDYCESNPDKCDVGEGGCKDFVDTCIAASQDCDGDGNSAVLRCTDVESVSKKLCCYGDQSPEKCAGIYDRRLKGETITGCG